MQVKWPAMLLLTYSLFFLNSPTKLRCYTRQGLVLDYQAPWLDIYVVKKQCVQHKCCVTIFALTSIFSARQLGRVLVKQGEIWRNLVCTPISGVSKGWRGRNIFACILLFSPVDFRVLLHAWKKSYRCATQLTQSVRKSMLQIVVVRERKECNWSYGWHPVMRRKLAATFGTDGEVRLVESARPQLSKNSCDVAPPLS